MVTLLGLPSQTTTAESDKLETPTCAKPATPSSEKYIPPHQKNLTLSPGTQASNVYSQQGTPPGFEQTTPPKSSYQSNGKSPVKTPSIGLKGKEPVNDFFPFENVSVYPSSPNSPIKSPEKSVPYIQGSNQSPGYFSRSPSRYSTETSGNHNNTSSQNGRYMGTENWQDGYHKHQTSRSSEKRRFAANFDNPPTNTFEPNYLNNQVEYQVENQFSSPVKSPDRRDSYRSPEKLPNEESMSPRPRPRLNIPSRDYVPFYPPKHTQDMPVGGNNSYHQPVDLIPPQFYQPGDKYGPYQQNVSPTKMYNNEPNSNRNGNQYYDDGYPDQSDGQYRKNSANNSHVGSTPERLDTSANLNSNNNENHSSKVKQSPVDNKGQFYGFERSPETPESAGIAEFSLGDLEHLPVISKDLLNERNRQERRQVQKEEQEMIERESKEQMALYKRSRFGECCRCFFCSSLRVLNHLYTHSPSSDFFQMANRIKM